jgi:PhzF family phenazine biosynthesis protein
VQLPIFVVDAFADRAFTGNPAGIVPLKEPLSDSLMQSVAAEMRHAETAFYYPSADSFQLRWFTPELEVDLCGHATLASAHILYQEGTLLPEQTAEFDTRSGRLTAKLTPFGIELDFPSLTTSPATEELAVEVSKAIGVPVKGVYKSQFDLLAELESEDAVRNLNPDLYGLGTMPFRGVMVTAKSETSTCDFVSRFFGPAAGVPEDPVTGSAHCCLAPFWAPILGKTCMVGYQASKRGGFVRVELRGDRVLLTGTAKTVLSGTLTI